MSEVITRHSVLVLRCMYRESYTAYYQDQQIHYIYMYIYIYIYQGTAVAQWSRCCATNWNVAGSIPAGVIGFFVGIKFFRSHYGPGVDSFSNINVYQ